MTPLTRTLSRCGVVAASGVTTVAAIAATGWLAGQAAADLHAQQSTPETPTADPVRTTPRLTAREVRAAHRLEGTRQVVLRPRPERTRVVYRYVTGGAVGTGGAVTTPAPQAPAPGPLAQPLPAPAPQPAPPPAPAPAPSSGS